MLSAVEPHLSLSHRNIFAQPMQANDGAIEWYSEINGQPIRLTDLPTSERMRAEALLTQKQHIISELKNKLAQDRRVSEDVLRMLTLASQQPADSSIWVIGDQPVITELSPPPIIAVAPVIAPQRIWWPWLLLLLLLAVLALFLLRGCLPVAPTEPAQPPESVTPTEPVTPEKPVQPTEPAAPIKPPKPVPPPVTKALCPAQRTVQQAPEVVIILDASGSMALSMDATPDELERWLEGDELVRDIEREPRRISLARQSTSNIIDKLPKDMNISLVAAADCRKVTASTPFPPSKRTALKNQINRIEPIGKTALAEALEQAGKLVDGVERDAIILLVTDGDETCGGDPCEVASKLKKSKPRLQINVVDILNTGAGNCIASNTGGSVFAVNNTQEFSNIMNKAMKEYIPEGCQ
ncbi:VWA domain-containing protein [Pectobacterium parmentieri]|nr:VWA domain-containing protein [Pectobacterium parmentieri]AYH13213.1 VWA domain-containing protein [Pectobacterium parmentieri]AYH21915.1 VWA domain-containing protein [Pectobacterium parmentieri]MBN3177601.1 VWA domain-containing protein [Pectobacterium parmentieri]QPK21973.1 VWA domain-containing protein [Pectobacterium parmentieri]